jgi:hypothetical protein
MEGRRKPSELEALIHSFPGRTLAAKLRRLMPEIEKRIEEGVRLSEIVVALNRSGSLGAEVRLATLKTYLRRFRRERRVGSGRGGRRPAGSPARPANPAAPVLPARPPPAPGHAVTPSLIRRIRDTDVDLEAYAEAGRALLKTKKGN